MKFWTNLLQKMNEKSDMFRNISPSRDNWITCGSGYSGLVYVFTITGNFARIELWINKGTKEENKMIFDKIQSRKEQIDSNFGHYLDWQRLYDGKGCRIAYYLNDVTVFDEADWDKMIDFMIINMIKFEKSIKDVLPEVIKK